MILLADTLISAEFPIITGDLPPNSSVTGTRFCDADCITCLPIDPEPVYRRWSK